MASYPAALSTLATNKADATTTATDHMTHHNQIADEVNAIEATLGINPHGTFATVRARLDASVTVKTITADAAAVVGTTMLAAAPGLDVAVTAGVPLHFIYDIRWIANATGTGARFSVDGPAVTSLAYNTGWNSTATAWAVAFQTAYKVGTTGTASHASSNLATVEGIIVPSANGTLSLFSAAEVASPGSVTVQAGSSLRYW